MRLQPALSNFARRRAGPSIAALLAACALTGTPNAHAEQPAPAPSYAVAMTLDAGGRQSAPRILARAGEQFAVATSDWRLEMTVRQAGKPGDVWLAGKVFKGDAVVGAPTLLARLNEQATIRVGDGDAPFTVSMIVSPHAPR